MNKIEHFGHNDQQFVWLQEGEALQPGMQITKNVQNIAYS